MRRSVWQRSTTAVLGLWLTATVSGVALQACPDHGGGWLGASGAMAAMAASHQDHRDHRDHRDHHGHQCTCPGACCTIGVITAPAGRLVAIPVVPVSVVIAAPRLEPDVRPHAAPDVTLPPPLGPPALRV